MSSDNLSHVLKAIAALGEDIKMLRGEVGCISPTLTDISTKVDQLERRVFAIETFPQPPFTRPRTYHSATEEHSVSSPVRRRTGHYG